MGLSVWQTRLQAHFEKLRSKRSSQGISRPIFALEHGLSVSELAELQADIREQIVNSRPSLHQSLPWVVYATEIGYQYAGDEYWQTFENSTPGWTIYGDRYWIRRCFIDFYLNYEGAIPSGTWAKHFSIICWPITHAILPQDLQRQLAKILYELRYTFTADLLDSPEKLGEQIAARSWNSTSRFRNFAQEPLLVGQIAAALLFHTEERSESFISPQTLQRIVTDLDRERRARDWLRRAQKHAGRLYRYGLRAEGERAPKEATREGSLQEATALAVEPRLLLRPVAATTWEVLVEIPDLSPLLDRFPVLQPTLTGSRCSIAGSVRRSPRARGAFLYGPQRDVLKHWPIFEELLLRFEELTPEVENLLSTYCFLRPGPTWLFRIRPDGQAYEVRSNVVRPAQSYILISSGDLISPGSLGTPISVTCEGVRGVRLDLPSVITMEWQAVIEDLHLNQARSLEVWPAGLPAVDWDGEGRGTWLSTDRPCIGIRVDHPVDDISVQIRDSEWPTLYLDLVDSDAISFVELPPLPSGCYTVRITTHSVQPEFDGQTGEFDVVIRQPRARALELSNTGPLMVVAEPATPSLEQLWEGLVEIEAYGPVGRQISCRASLLDKDSREPMVTKELPRMALPVHAATWRSHFQEHFQHRDEIRRLCDLAHICKIEFDGEELGFFLVTCEREFTPVRWIVQHIEKQHTLRLFDDTGTDALVKVTRYDFETPDIPVQIEEAQAIRGLEVPQTGGMYVARVARYRRAVIVPPQVRTIRLTDLSINPCFSRYPRSPAGVSAVVKLFEVWAAARIPGDILALFRQRSVLVSIVQHLFAIICGARWERIEEDARTHDSEESIRQMALAIGAYRSERSLGVVLHRDYTKLAADPIPTRIARVASLAKKFIVFPETSKMLTTARKGVVVRRQKVWDSSQLEWLSEFTLRLASCPDQIRSWSGPKFSEGIERILKVPTLARAARFLVLAIDSHLRYEIGGGKQLYKGWKW